MNNIFNYLDLLYPNPKGELNYNNDYELLIAVVLSAQTTDIKVNRVTKELFSKYDINTLGTAYISDIENILKELGMYKKKAVYIKHIAYDLVNKYNNKIPNSLKDLMKLDGVGRKSANLVLSIIYNKPLIAVDTHVSRVSKRLGLVNKDDNVLKIENMLYKIIPESRLLRTHHQLVLFGRYECKALKPNCKNCKLINICKYEKKNV